jgi:uncharacterized protein (DUF952 family)
VRLVYKVVSQAEWANAERDGVFDGAAIDHRDGYIHLSSGEQVEKTVSLYFADRDDLVLVALDAEGFGQALKWERSRGGALFPHLYAALPLEKVAWSKRFSSRAPHSLRAVIAEGA